MLTDLMLAIFLTLAVAGWVCFGVVVWLYDAIGKGWQEVHRLHEERHQRKAQVIAAMGRQIQLISALNVTMARN